MRMHRGQDEQRLATILAIRVHNGGCAAEFAADGPRVPGIGAHIDAARDIGYQLRAARI